VSRTKCSNGAAGAGEDADGHVGEHGDCCIWAVRYAQQLLQTRGCGEIEWARGGSPRRDGKGYVEERVYAQGLQSVSNTLTLTMVCAGIATHQETTFHGGDSFETTMTNTVNGVTKVTQIKSRRTGDCKGAD